MLTVKQAIEVLEQNDVPVREHTLRQWLRQGQILGEIESKKYGWLISENSLDKFIIQYKSEEDNKSNELLYQQLYDEAILELKEKQYKRISNNKYDERFILCRDEFRRLVHISKQNKRLFLKYCDEKVFSWGRRTPRNTIEVTVLGDWIAYDLTVIILDRTKYAESIDQENSKIELIYQVLIAYLLQRFMTDKS